MTDGRPPLGASVPSLPYLAPRNAVKGTVVRTVQTVIRGAGDPSRCARWPRSSCLSSGSVSSMSWRKAASTSSSDMELAPRDHRSSRRLLCSGAGSFFLRGRHCMFGLRAVHADWAALIVPRVLPRRRAETPAELKFDRRNEIGPSYTTTLMPMRASPYNFKFVSCWGAARRDQSKRPYNATYGGPGGENAAGCGAFGCGEAGRRRARGMRKRLLVPL